MTGILTQAQYQQFLIIAANIVYPGAGTAIQLGLLSLHAIAGDCMDYGRALASIAASAAVQYLGGKLCDACGYPAGIAGAAAGAAVGGGNVGQAVLMAAAVTAVQMGYQYYSSAPEGEAAVKSNAEQERGNDGETTKSMNVSESQATPVSEGAAGGCSGNCKGVSAEFGVRPDPRYPGDFHPYEFD